MIARGTNGLQNCQLREQYRQLGNEGGLQKVKNANNLKFVGLVWVCLPFSSSDLHHHPLPHFKCISRARASFLLAIIRQLSVPKFITTL